MTTHVEAMGDGSKTMSEDNGLPATHGWYPHDAFPCVVLRAKTAPRHAYIADARESGMWQRYASAASTSAIESGAATPRDGETLLAAAQREAVAALWRCDGFLPAGWQWINDAHESRLYDPGNTPRAIVCASVWWTCNPAVGRGDCPDVETGKRAAVCALLSAGTVIDARRVDARPAGDEVGPLSLIPADQARIHRAMGSTPIVDPDEVFGRKLRVYPEPIATPASKGTGASAPLLPADHPLASPVEPAPYYDPITGRCPHGTRRPHECRDGCEDDPPAPVASEPTDAAELARLLSGERLRDSGRWLPGLAECVAYVRRTQRSDGQSKIVRLASAAELLSAERATWQAASGTADPVDVLRATLESDRLLDERDVTIADLRTRVAELEAEIETLRFSSRAGTLDGQPIGLARRDIAAGENVIAGTMLQMHMVRADAAPTGANVARLLARVEDAQRASEKAAARGGGSNQAIRRAGEGTGLQTAARMIRSTLGTPSPLDEVVAKVLAMPVEAGEPIDFANDIHCDVDMMSKVGGETCENFTRIAALAIQGALACGTKGGA